MMKHRNSHLLIGYWSRIRKGRAAPDQGDIDPRCIKRMLSQVFILDAENPARPFYRLAGTALCHRFGLELRATGFYRHWEAQCHDTLALLLGQSLATKQPLALAAIGSTSHCAMLEMETVLAPLTFGPGAPRRFLGMVQFLNDSATLAAAPITYERLMGSKLIREIDSTERMDDPPPPSPRMERKAPHLRLVVSRNTPITLHSEIDEAMRDVIAALDLTPPVKLVR